MSSIHGDVEVNESGSRHRASLDHISRKTSYSILHDLDISKTERPNSASSSERVSPAPQISTTSSFLSSATVGTVSMDTSGPISSISRSRSSSNPLSSSNLPSSANGASSASNGNTSLRSSTPRLDPFDVDEYDELENDDFSKYAYRPSRRQINIQWIRNSIISAAFVLLWYAFSLSISIYNKWMFSSEHLNFKFPILTTSGHQFMQFTLSVIVLKCAGGPYRRFLAATSLGNDAEALEQQNARDEEYTATTRRKKDEDEDFEETRRLTQADDADGLDISDREDGDAADVIDDDDYETRRLNDGERDTDGAGGPRDKWSWLKSYLRGIVPTATASGADIGLGNASLRIVSLSFYTMVKSSSLGFVLLFGILFKLEIATWEIFCIIGTMSVGVVMMVAGETEFSLVGFFFVLGAAMFSGLRWSLTQLLLRQDANLSHINTHNDPVRTIMYLAPPMGVFLFVWGCISEGLPSFFAAPMWREKGVLGGMVIMMIPGVIAFLMTLSEFFLLNRTSVLTLSIAGIFKELLTLIAAALYFGDRLSSVNIVGLVVTFFSIVMYNVYKFRRFKNS